jgi:hypothetical protein
MIIRITCIIQYLHIGCSDVKGFFLSLYSVWPIPIVVRGILKVLLSDSVWLVARHLSWIVFHYYAKFFALVFVRLSLICMPFSVFSYMWYLATL